MKLDHMNRPYVTQADLDKLVRARTPVSLNESSLSARVRGHDSYRYRQDGSKEFRLTLSDVDFKTLLTESNFSPIVHRTNVVSPFPQRRTTVSDLIRQDPTTEQTVRFVREVQSDTINAVVAEGGTKPEAAFGFDDVDSPVAKVAAWIPVSGEALEDVNGLETLLDARLLWKLKLSEEHQILNGAGGTVMTGLYVQSGVMTQPQGSDSLTDAIYKAISKCRTQGFAEPTAVLIHPDDYDAERLAKDSMGNYYWGPPTLPPPPYIWEKPAIITTAATVGSPLVGDFGYAHLSRRGDAILTTSKSHGVYFAQNVYALRLEIRSSFEIYRPSAFCYVTP